MREENSNGKGKIIVNDKRNRRYGQSYWDF